MTITINGSGTITGVSAGGLPSGTVTQATLATPVAGTGPAFSAYSTSSQTISHATSTKVTLDTEAFDTNNNFASSRFTPTVAGYYQINASVKFNSAAGANYILTMIYKNGSLYSGVYGFFTTNGYGGAALADLIYCNGSTDYIELYTNQAQGSSQTTQSGCFLSGILVRGA